MFVTDGIVEPLPLLLDDEEEEEDDDEDACETALLYTFRRSLYEEQLLPMTLVYTLAEELGEDMPISDAKSFITDETSPTPEGYAVVASTVASSKAFFNVAIFVISRFFQISAAFFFISSLPLV